MKQTNKIAIEPFNLLEGNPFSYSELSISENSGTEDFEMKVRNRDRGCIVCGVTSITEHTHIVPKTEEETWRDMRKRGFIPNNAKSVNHETRNGILLCPTHHRAFNHFSFFIRWLPEQKVFVLINHCQHSDFEGFHGRVVNLKAEDDHVPFHGSFLIHEMRVRGKWSLRKDRAIPPPTCASNGGGCNDDADKTKHRSDHSVQHQTEPLYNVASSDAVQTKTILLTDPFKNPAKLQALRDSFAQQPNWKAAVREGETWDGTTEENIAKWQRVMKSP